MVRPATPAPIIVTEVILLSRFLSCWLPDLEHGGVAVLEDGPEVLRVRELADGLRAERLAFDAVHVHVVDALGVSEA